MPGSTSDFKIVRLLAIAYALCLHSPGVLAVTPAPDGGYPGENTAEGQDALFRLTTGYYNTAVGYEALYGDTSGVENTAIGAGALNINTTGSNNTGVGYAAMELNSRGNNNTAIGAAALQFNVSGSSSTAIGFEALFSNTDGGDNVALGDAALFRNNGSDNVAVGDSSLGSNTNGSFNIALGTNAGVNLTTGSNNIDIGNKGKAGESNAIRVGTQGTQKSTFVAGIYGTAVTGSTVVVNSAGKLGVASSSARFKEQIKPMDKSSDALLGLRPVTFRYKEVVDPDRAPQFGLVAEEVDKVAPELVVHDENGKPFTVRYEAVNAMLLNEFLKEHRSVEKQAADLEQQRKEIEELRATIQEVRCRIANRKH